MRTAAQQFTPEQGTHNLGDVREALVPLLDGHGAMRHAEAMRTLPPQGYVVAWETHLGEERQSQTFGLLEQAQEHLRAIQEGDKMRQELGERRADRLNLRIKEEAS